MKNNEVLTEVWARGTLGGVKKKGLTTGTVQRSGNPQAPAWRSQLFLLYSKEESGVILEVWGVGTWVVGERRQGLQFSCTRVWGGGILPIVLCCEGTEANVPPTLESVQSWWLIPFILSLSIHKDKQLYHFCADFYALELFGSP